MLSSYWSRAVSNDICAQWPLRSSIQWVNMCFIIWPSLDLEFGWKKTPSNPFFWNKLYWEWSKKKMKTKKKEKKKRVWLFWIKIKLCLLGGKIMITWCMISECFWRLIFVLTHFLYQGVVITRSRTKCLDQMRYVIWVTLLFCEFKSSPQLQLFESALLKSDFCGVLLNLALNFLLTQSLTINWLILFSALTQQTRPGLFLRQIMTTGNHHWSLTTEGLLWVNS